MTRVNGFSICFANCYMGLPNFMKAYSYKCNLKWKVKVMVERLILLVMELTLGIYMTTLSSIVYFMLFQVSYRVSPI